jgi:PAS domain S-box-containing protein
MEFLATSKNKINIIDILNAVPAMISYVGTDLRYSYANEAFLGYYGLDLQSITGKTVEEIAGPEAYKALEKFILKALNGESSCFELAIENDNDTQYLQVNLIPDTDANGKVKGYISFTNSVSEKTASLIRQKEELKKSEERYHKMVDEVQEYAIILLDNDGNIIDWNKGAENIKGYKAEEILGQNFRIFYLPEDRQKKLPETLINKAIHEGKAEHEGWRVRKDGTKFWGSIIITALHDDNNNIIGFSKVTRDLTERKAAEEKQKKYYEDIERKNEALRRSEERYHRMVAEVEDYAIILLDRSGYIQNWNKGAQNIKGYKPDEIIGKNFRLFYTNEDREKKIPEQLLQIATEKGRAIHDGWRIRKDGTRFWGSVVITALHDDNNNIIGFSKVTRDLTERKAAEEKQQRYLLELEQKNIELKKNEERYHKMIAEVEDYAIILLDLKGDIQKWNKGAQNIKGYTAEDIIGRNFSVFYGTEDREAGLPMKLLNEAKEKGKATHEGWRVKKDGTKFWGSVVITAIHDEAGNVIGYSKVTRDLTERKAAEEKLQRFLLELQQKNEQLRRSEERYHRMIAEVADYAIILLDVEGNIQNWNRGAENIKGYTADEITGKHFRVFYGPEDRERKLPERLLNQARTYGKADHEGWRVKKDGTKFWGSVVITALHDERNNIIGFSKVTRDLTERKLADDKLKQNAGQLEMQNKELEQFAYVASHDLQEPLRKIRTFNSLILEHEEKNLSEKGKDYFERSIAAADRMHKLIDDLLTYSRATRDTHHFELVDLNPIVARIRSSYKESDKKVIIESDVLPEIRGMRFQFEQLIENLIGNGIKYQEPGNTPRIRIHYRIVNGNEIAGKDFSSSTKFHQISFTDNGIGFDQQYADKIFEMFHRLHGRSEFTGSGIGLAIVKKIVQNYGGFIMAEGEPGKGATFNVYFPF